MITYRELKATDMPHLAETIWKMWASPAVKKDPDVAIHYGYFVLYWELIHSTIAFVADDDGKPCGICVVDIKDGHPLHMDYFGKMIEHAVMMSRTPEGNENLRHSAAVQEVFHDSESVLEGKGYGAEVALFINDEDHRGKGIGSGMFSHMAKYLEEHGVKRFYLHSDESSYHQFYGEHRGMEQIDARPSTGSLGDVENVTLYIYGDEVSAQARK